MAQLAAQLAGVGYWRYQVATGDVMWSDLIYEIHGLDPSEGPPDLAAVSAAFHPDDAPALEASIERALQAGEPYSLDCRLIRADGQERQVVGQGVCETGADGKVEVLYGTLMDVTEQRRADSEVRRNEALYRLLAENATDIIGRISLEGETLYVTPSASAIMGYSNDRLVGSKTLEFVHRDDGAQLVAGYRRCMNGGPPERITYRFRHADGHWIWLEASPRLVRDEQGRPKEFIDVARDVTARKQMEAELVAARQAAEIAADAKARFLANMSHELRTPITAVLGFTELLAGQRALDEEGRRYVERIASGGRALLATVNDVLDFSRLEAGQVRISPAAIEPAALARETLDLFEVQAGAKGLSLSLRARAPLPAWAFADGDRIRQVLLNLIGNAVKFTQAGGVMLETDYNDGVASFAVLDTGGGMAPDELGRLFQRFSQVDGGSTRAHQGAGLGLAICKGLVEAMGGEVGVDSEIGEGSRFWFTVPMPPVAAPVAEADAARARAPAPAAATRVLVADDNVVNRELVRAILSPFEVDLVEAEDGIAAIEAAAIEAFDVILMDIRMPACDGRRAARAIRAGSGPNRTTTILSFSADGEAPDDAGDDARLFNGRLTKPLTPGALLEALAEATSPRPCGDEDQRGERDAG
jgi:PAS domain S-box-containing protein